MPSRQPHSRIYSLPPSPLSASSRPILSLSSVELANLSSDYDAEPSQPPFASSPLEATGFAYRAFPTTTDSDSQKGKSRADTDTLDDDNPGSDDEETSSTRIFSQLEVIKRIQGEIARSHLELERIGHPDHLQDFKKDDGDWWSASTEGAGAGPAADGGGGAPSPGASFGLGKTKAERERSNKAYFAMEEEFTAREEGVDGIMKQLSELSVALKAFHALPSPILFPHTTKERPTAATRDRTRAPSSPTTPTKAEAGADSSRPSSLRRGSFT